MQVSRRQARQVGSCVKVRFDRVWVRASTQGMPAGFGSGGTGGPVVWKPRPGGEGLAAVELNDVGYGVFQ